MNRLSPKKVNRLSPKKVNTLYAIILLAAALIAFIGAFSGKSALSVIGVLVIFADIAFRLICYKCPHCGKYLDRSSGDFCPYCGREVNEPE